MRQVYDAATVASLNFTLIALYYPSYRTFKQEEAQKQAQRRGTLDNFDDSLPLNETTVDYHDNEITKDGIPKDELTQ